MNSDPNRRGDAVSSDPSVPKDPLSESSAPSPQEGQAKIWEGPPFVVAIGASAGGYESLLEFFQTLGQFRAALANSSFLVMQHSSPGFPSYLSELLSAQIPIPVSAVSGFDPTPYRLGEVLVLSSGHSHQFGPEGLQILDNQEPILRRSRSIDRFFRNVSTALRSRLACVVLSGTGSDGAQGCLDARRMGSYILAEDPSLAPYGEMPQSVIRAEAADAILLPQSMLEHLEKLILFRNSVGPQSAVQSATPALSSGQSIGEVSSAKEDFQSPFFHGTSPNLLSSRNSFRNSVAELPSEVNGPSRSFLEGKQDAERIADIRPAELSPEFLLSLPGDVTLVFDQKLSIRSAYGDFALLLKLTEGRVSSSLVSGFHPDFLTVFRSLLEKSLLSSDLKKAHCMYFALNPTEQLLLKLQGVQESPLMSVLSIRSVPLSEGGFGTVSPWANRTEKKDILERIHDLQSTNEELQVMNEELQSVQYSTHLKMSEARQRSESLEKLFALNSMACVVLDAHLAIEAYWDPAQKFMKLRPADLGRPLLEVGGAGALSLWEIASQVRHLGRSSVCQIQGDGEKWTVLAQVQAGTSPTGERTVKGLSLFLAGEEFYHLWQEQPKAKAAL